MCGIFKLLVYCIGPIQTITNKELCCLYKIGYNDNQRCVEYGLTRVRLNSCFGLVYSSTKLFRLEYARHESRIQIQKSSPGFDFKTIRSTNSSRILEQIDGKKKVIQPALRPILWTMMCVPGDFSQQYISVTNIDYVYIFITHWMKRILTDF